MTLLEKTVQLLNKEGVDLHEIHSQTNLHYAWLVRIKRGDFNDPGVNKIQELYEYLTGKTIKL